MNLALEARYFEWLCAQVGDTSDYRVCRFLQILYHTEFVWLISGDDNRAEDGTDLRPQFLHQSFINKSNLRHFDGGCSVLEMLVAFSRIASFETDDPAEDWFWIMINNLASANGVDILGEDPQPIVDMLEKFIWRTYDRKGNGGLFPMRRTRNDQRKIEVWYQFSEYLLHHSGR